MILSDYKKLKKLDKNKLIDIIIDLRNKYENSEETPLNQELKDKNQRKKLLQKARDIKKDNLKKQIIKNQEKIKDFINKNTKTNQKVKVADLIKELKISKQTYYNQELDKFVKALRNENNIKNELKPKIILVKTLYKGKDKKEIVVKNDSDEITEKYRVKNNFEFQKKIKKIKEEHPHVLFKIIETNRWEE